MKKAAASALCWLIPTMSVLAAAIAVQVDLNGWFFYPRARWESVAASFLWIAPPNAVAAGLTLFFASAQRPSRAMLLRSVGSTFFILGFVFAIWLNLINVVDSSSFERNFPKLTILLAIIATLLPILTFLFLPFMMMHKTRKIVWGPWWPALWPIISLPVIMLIVRIVSGTSLAQHVGSLAASLGGHYYTWLNLVDPGLICATAIASSVLVSLRWSKELDAARHAARDFG